MKSPTSRQTSKGSIYFHFPNKERLFLSLVDQFADLIERQVKDAIAQEEEGMRRVQIALGDLFAYLWQVPAAGQNSSWSRRWVSASHSNRSEWKSMSALLSSLAPICAKP